MDRLRSIVAYIASLGSMLFGKMNLEELAIYVGIVTAVGTFIINWYYRYKQNAREERDEI
jgi:Bacteriophage holin family HP1